MKFEIFFKEKQNPGLNINIHNVLNLIKSAWSCEKEKSATHNKETNQ